MTWGTSAPSVILDVWYNNNIANENRRMLLTSIGVPVANMMGVLSSGETITPFYYHMQTNKN